MVDSFEKNIRMVGRNVRDVSDGLDLRTGRFPRFGPLPSFHVLHGQLAVIVCFEHDPVFLGQLLRKFVF
jgi:hypothetical protein